MYALLSKRLLDCPKWDWRSRIPQRFPVSRLPCQLLDFRVHRPTPYISFDTTPTTEDHHFLGRVQWRNLISLCHLAWHVVDREQRILFGIVTFQSVRVAPRSNGIIWVVLSLGQRLSRKNPRHDVCIKQRDGFSPLTKVR